ncbi:MAG: MaoC family dehydratase N-terminal domain-containing protein [Variovorax sp.]|nr:MaoC family dehydratase N-terminal domain-containing protein [Variovorax sp.]
MPLHLANLQDWQFPEKTTIYTDKDTMLYALSLGFGESPTDPAELPFVYEDGLRAVPTMGAVLCHPGPWLTDPRTGATRSKVVHGEQRMRFHAPLPPQGQLTARSRVIGIQDKGADKGALLHLQRELYGEDGTLVITLRHSSFCRADGGCGSFGESLVLNAPPARAPDRSFELKTLPQAALIYRLNVDRNPLHADPAKARQAGFDRPPLHGLCTYGMAARAILKMWLDHDPARLASLDTRFSASVFPGETLVFETWREGGGIAFRALAKERGVKVLDNGWADIRG